MALVIVVEVMAWVCILALRVAWLSIEVGSLALGRCFRKPGEA